MLRPDPEKNDGFFKKIVFSNGFFFEMVSNGFSNGYFSKRFPIEITIGKTIGKTIRNHFKYHFSKRFPPLMLKNLFEMAKHLKKWNGEMGNLKDRNPTGWGPQSSGSVQKRLVSVA